MADEVQTPLNDGELEIMQPIYTSEPARVPAVGDVGEFQTFENPSVYVPYVQYDSIERLAVYGSVEGVSSIYVNSQQYVLPIPKPLTAGDVWHSKVKSSYDKRIVLDGSETWTEYTDEAWQGTGYHVYRTYNADALISQYLASNKYPYRRGANNFKGALGVTSGTQTILFSVVEQKTVDDWKAYLASQKAAGAPVIIYRQSTAYDGTNGLTVSVADYQGEIYANDFVDIFTDDGELWVDGGDFVEVAVNNIVLNGLTNDKRAGEYGTPQIHTFP